MTKNYCECCDGYDPDRAGLCEPCKAEARSEMKELGYDMNINEEKAIDCAYIEAEQDEVMRRRDVNSTRTAEEFLDMIENLEAVNLPTPSHVTVWIQVGRISGGVRPYFLTYLDLEQVVADMRTRPASAPIEFWWFRHPDNGISVEMRDVRPTFYA